MKWFIPSWNGDLRLVSDEANPRRTVMLIERPTVREQQIVNIIGEQCVKQGMMRTWEPLRPRTGWFAQKKWQFVIDAPIETVGPMAASIMRPGPAVLTAIRFVDGQCTVVSQAADELVEAVSPYREPARLPAAPAAADKQAAAVAAQCPSCKKRYCVDEDVVRGRIVRFRCNKCDGIIEILGKGAQADMVSVFGRPSELLAVDEPSSPPTTNSSASGSSALAVAAKKASKLAGSVAATVKRATPCCPQCMPGSIGPATEALLAFLSPEQHDSWARRRALTVDGGLSGHRYLLAHRHSQLARRIGRVCYDLDSRHVVHFHDWTVPPEEEILSAMLILEHREHWLRNEATLFAGPSVLRFKNPFGGGSDGVWDSTLTREIGEQVLGDLGLERYRKNKQYPTAVVRWRRGRRKSPQSDTLL